MRTSAAMRVYTGRTCSCTSEQAEIPHSTQGANSPTGCEWEEDVLSKWTDPIRRTLLGTHN